MHALPDENYHYLKEDSMRYSLVIVVLSLLLIGGCQNETPLAPVSESDQGSVSFAKPAPYLLGNTDCNFIPENGPQFWNGTVDFGTGTVYGLTFTSLEPAHTALGQAILFEEEFVIYELGSDWTEPENVYMRGWEKGVVTLANSIPDPSRFHANGKITFATGPFEGWAGCTVHLRGLVYWTTDGSGLPARAVGMIRIN